jgi:hypothetical protein
MSDFLSRPLARIPPAVRLRFERSQRRSRRREARFARIFRHHREVWGGMESASGRGSDLDNTETIRVALPALITEWEIRTMIDTPRGDFHWMSRLDLELEHYIGVDIVADLIELNRQRYGIEEVREFRVMDLVGDRLPAADLILCRDGLVHLSLPEACGVIENFRASGARFLLATTFPACAANREIKTGQWRPLNLQSRPLNFSEPLARINEIYCDAIGDRRDDKWLGLWRIADLPAPALDHKA